MKYLKILWILITVFIIWWIFYFFVLPNINKQNQVEIPNVVGMSLEEAQSNLKKSEIKYNVQFVNGNKNMVVKTYPEYGMRIYKSYEIVVYAEAYTEDSKDFIGTNFTDTRSIIEDYAIEKGYSLDISYRINEGAINNKVIEQRLEDNKLSIVVSLSNDYFFMPKLVGLNINDALEIMLEYKLIPTIIYFDSPIINDTVIYQSITEGTAINKQNKSNFDIYVSKGIEIMDEISIEE